MLGQGGQTSKTAGLDWRSPRSLLLYLGCQAAFMVCSLALFLSIWFFAFEDDTKSLTKLVYSLAALLLWPALDFSFWLVFGNKEIKTAGLLAALETGERVIWRRGWWTHRPRNLWIGLALVVVAAIAIATLALTGTVDRFPLFDVPILAGLGLAGWFVWDGNYATAIVVTDRRVVVPWASIPMAEIQCLVYLPSDQLVIEGAGDTIVIAARVGRVARLAHRIAEVSGAAVPDVPGSNERTAVATSNVLNCVLAVGALALLGYIGWDGVRWLVTEQSPFLCICVFSVALFGAFILTVIPGELLTIVLTRGFMTREGVRCWLCRDEMPFGGSLSLRLASRLWGESMGPEDKGADAAS